MPSDTMATLLCHFHGHYARGENRKKKGQRKGKEKGAKERRRGKIREERE